MVEEQNQGLGVEAQRNNPPIPPEIVTPQQEAVTHERIGSSIDRESFRHPASEFVYINVMPSAELSEAARIFLRFVTDEKGIPVATMTAIQYKGDLSMQDPQGLVAIDSAIQLYLNQRQWQGPEQAALRHEITLMNAVMTLPLADTVGTQRMVNIKVEQQSALYLKGLTKLYPQSFHITLNKSDLIVDETTCDTDSIPEDMKPSTFLRKKWDDEATEHSTHDTLKWSDQTPKEFSHGGKKYRVEPVSAVNDPENTKWLFIVDGVVEKCLSKIDLRRRLKELPEE